MAPTPITSYFVNSGTSGSGTTTTLATPSFTPSNGEVIVVKAATWDLTVSMGTPTGGSQTYTSQVVNTDAGFHGWLGLWTAVVSGSPGAMTISSTPSAVSHHSMTVERWSGAQLAATPATASASSGTASAPSATITTVAADSVVSWADLDNGAGTATGRAYLSSATEDGISDGYAASNSTHYYAYQSAVATGSQTVGMSAPSTQKWQIVAVEVQNASGAAAPQDPPMNRARLTRASCW